MADEHAGGDEDAEGDEDEDEEDEEDEEHGYGEEEDEEDGPGAQDGDEREQSMDYDLADDDEDGGDSGAASGGASDDLSDFSLEGTEDVMLTEKDRKGKMAMVYTDRERDVGEGEGLNDAAAAAKEREREREYQRAKQARERAVEARERREGQAIIEKYLTPKPGARRRAKRNERLALKRGAKNPSLITGELAKKIGRMNMAYTLGRMQEAKQLAKEVCKARPECHEAWTVIAEVCREEGNVRDALQYERMAAELDTGAGAAPWVLISRGYREEGNLNVALSTMNKAIRLRRNEPGGPEGLQWLVFERAKIYEQMGDRQQAGSSLRKLLGARMRDPDLVTEIARYFYDEGSPELALEMVERMVYECAESRRGRRHAEVVT